MTPRLVLLLLLSPALARAEHSGAHTASDSLGICHEAGQFVLFGTSGDEQSLRDIADALQQWAPEVCRTLGYDYQRTVRVDVFPDQARKDRDPRSRWNRGHFAHSDSSGILLVSPRNEIPNQPVSYHTRVLIAVHEFAHLVNNAINPGLPLWLNEGVAIFAAPHAPYSWVCQHHFPSDRIPRFNDLLQAYNEIPVADLFAFTVVDFVVAEYGIEALIQLIRHPKALERIIGCNVTEFERRWRMFMERHYARA